MPRCWFITEADPRFGPREDSCATSSKRTKNQPHVICGLKFFVEESGTQADPWISLDLYQPEKRVFNFLEVPVRSFMLGPCNLQIGVP